MAQGNVFTDVYRLKVEGEDALDRLNKELAKVAKEYLAGTKSEADFNAAIAAAFPLMSQLQSELSQSNTALKAYAREITTQFTQIGGAIQALPQNIVTAYRVRDEATAELNKIKQSLKDSAQLYEQHRLSEAEHNAAIAAAVPAQMYYRGEIKRTTDEIKAYEDSLTAVKPVIKAVAANLQALPQNIVTQYQIRGDSAIELKKIREAVRELDEARNVGAIGDQEYRAEIEKLGPVLAHHSTQVRLAEDAIREYHSALANPAPVQQASQTMQAAVNQTKALVGSIPEKVLVAFETQVRGEAEIKRLKAELDEMAQSVLTGTHSTDQLKAAFAATFPAITRLTHEVEIAKDTVNNFGREYGMTGKEMRKQNIIYFQGAQMVQDAMYGISNAVNNLSYMMQISKAPAYWQAIVTSIGVFTLMFRDQIDEAFRSIGDIITGKTKLIHTELDPVGQRLEAVTEALKGLKDARSVSESDQIRYNELLREEVALRQESKNIEESRAAWKEMFSMRPGDEERKSAFRDLFMTGEGRAAGQTLARALESTLPESLGIREMEKRKNNVIKDISSKRAMISGATDWRSASMDARIRDDIAELEKEVKQIDEGIAKTVLDREMAVKSKLTSLMAGNEDAIRSAMQLPGVDKGRLTKVLGAPGEKRRQEEEKAKKERDREREQAERDREREIEQNNRTADALRKEKEKTFEDGAKAARDAAEQRQREQEQQLREREQRASQLAGPIEDRVGTDVSDFLRRGGPGNLDAAAARVTPQVAERIRGAVGDLADDVARIVVDKIATELRGAFAGDEAAKGMPGQVAALIQELVAKNQQAWIEMRTALQMGNMGMARNLNREIQNNVVRIRSLQNPMMRRVMN